MASLMSLGLFEPDCMMTGMSVFSLASLIFLTTSKPSMSGRFLSRSTIPIFAPPILMNCKAFSPFSAMTGSKPAFSIML